MVSLSKITKRGKAIFLAYDQGLEHGPVSDFNDKNVDPLYILDIAKKGRFNAVVFGVGIAEKYRKEIKKSGVPLILKLNGKTKLFKGEPKSAVLGSVKDAVRLKANAVGFTIYIGSQFEEEMLEEFAKIREGAHKKGMPVIAWIYPRGKSVKKLSEREKLAYAARTGLEIGADIVKVHWNGNVRDLSFAVKSAGRTKLVVAGGLKKGEKEFLKNVAGGLKKGEKEFLKNVAGVVKAGGSGLAVGRNVWQAENPMHATRDIKRIIWKC